MGISTQRLGAVAVISLDDEPSRNALTGDTARELSAHLLAAQADESVASVVIRGEHGTFCAGAHRDLLRAARSDADRRVRADLEAIYDSFLTLGNLTIPTVAAVRGAAVGAGVNLALAADVRVVADDARFIAGFLRIGAHPGGGHFLLMERAGGPQATVAMSVLGQTVAADRLVALGLAWEAVSDAEVDQRAVQIAAGATDPELVRAAMATYRVHSASRQLPWLAAVRAEQAVQLWSFGR